MSGEDVTLADVYADGRLAVGDGIVFDGERTEPV
jgi:hypothetical protein